LTSDPQDCITVTFHLLNKNWEMLYSAAAMNGEDMQSALNRASAMYETMNRAEPGTVVSWSDRSDVERSLIVLPFRLPLPWWLRWLKIEVGI
jgi:hypothetical protein